MYEYVHGVDLAALASACGVPRSPHILVPGAGELMLTRKQAGWLVADTSGTLSVHPVTSVNSRRANELVHGLRYMSELPRGADRQAVMDAMLADSGLDFARRAYAGQRIGVADRGVLEARFSAVVQESGASTLVSFPRPPARRRKRAVPDRTFTLVKTAGEGVVLGDGRTVSEDRLMLALTLAEIERWATAAGRWEPLDGDRLMRSVLDERLQVDLGHARVREALLGPAPPSLAPASDPMASTLHAGMLATMDAAHRLAVPQMSTVRSAHGVHTGAYVAWPSAVVWLGEGIGHVHLLRKSGLLSRPYLATPLGRACLFAALDAMTELEDAEMPDRADVVREAAVSVIATPVRDPRAILGHAAKRLAPASSRLVRTPHPAIAGLRDRVRELARLGTP